MTFADSAGNAGSREQCCLRAPRRSTYHNLSSICDSQAGFCYACAHTDRSPPRVPYDHAHSMLGERSFATTSHCINDAVSLPVGHGRAVCATTHPPFLCSIYMMNACGNTSKSTFAFCLAGRLPDRTAACSVSSKICALTDTRPVGEKNQQRVLPLAPLTTEFRITTRRRGCEVNKFQRMGALWLHAPAKPVSTKGWLQKPFSKEGDLCSN